MRRSHSIRPQPDFWRTDFYLDLMRIAVELLVAAAIFIFLRPRANGSDAAPVPEP